MKASETLHEFLLDLVRVLTWEVRRKVNLCKNISCALVPHTRVQWSCGEVHPEVLLGWPIVRSSICHELSELILGWRRWPLITSCASMKQFSNKLPTIGLTRLTPVVEEGVGTYVKVIRRSGLMNGRRDRISKGSWGTNSPCTKL
jgi:hypothetical protein